MDSRFRAADELVIDNNCERFSKINKSLGRAHGKELSSVNTVELERISDPMRPSAPRLKISPIPT